MRLKTFICGILMAMVFVLLPAQPVNAAVYRWPVGQNRICVASDTNAYWAIDNAVNQWNSIRAGQPKMYRAHSCPWRGSVSVWTVYRPGWYGALTTKYVINGRIAHVDIRLNNASARWMNYTHRTAWRKFATVHEFGHAYGVGHSLVQGSVMCYCTNYWHNGGRLHWTDRRSIWLIY